METIPISPHDFLAIMIAVRNFAATSASFATSHAALAERMARTKAVLAQNNAILMQIQSHLGLPHISPSPSVPAHASPAHPPAAAALGYPAPPTASLDLLVVAAVVASSPAAPSPPVSSATAQPTQDEVDIPPTAHT